MKIIINSSHQRFGGAIQVALSFINECKNFNNHEFVVWVGPGVAKSLKADTFPSNFKFEYFDFGVINLFKSFKINRVLRREEAKEKPDVIIATSGPSYFNSEAPQIIGFNLPLYIYPESPFLRNPSFKTAFRRRVKKYLHFYFFKRDASYYVVQTDDVNKRVRKAFNTDKVLTVTNTASSYYSRKRNYPNRLPERKKGFMRFVTISSYYGHKNLELIPEVLGVLRDKGVNNVEFVVTLEEGVYDRYIGNQEGIYNVGPMRPETCPALYKECDAMFLPTLAECFSASYPEAMIMEKPIVTTDLGFARSICGKAALYFKPKDAQSASEQIEKLLCDKGLANKLVRSGIKELEKFDSPEGRAKKYIELCATLINSQ